MKISKETWKAILKVVGAAIAAIASALGVQAMNRP
ncbi:MAG: smalltalk protein [Bacteroides sp.]|nr:smalltalk protein [Bacteroides sp.]